MSAFDTNYGSFDDPSGMPYDPSVDWTPPADTSAPSYDPSMGATPAYLSQMIGAVPGDTAQEAFQRSEHAANTPGAMQQQPVGFMSQVGDWLNKLTQGDKTTLGQMKLGLGALGLMGSLFQSQTPRGQITPAQMQAIMKSPYSNWTPGQQQAFNRYFYSALPQFHYTPPNVGGVVKIPGMAMGGAVMPPSPRGGALAAMVAQPQALGRMRPLGALGHLPAFAAGGSLVNGPGGGQDDRVPARLSPGEYVFDADAVSALGDGNNAEGARRLDAMRENLRDHKRSAPADQIPPKAKAPLHYLKGA